jgi:hypothetical protein
VRDGGRASAGTHEETGSHRERGTPNPSAARRDNADNPDELRELVEACLGVLRDDRSLAFYTKCAKVLGREAFLNILGGVRQMIQEGSPLELARKTFTATAKRRAQAMGRDL